MIRMRVGSNGCTGMYVYTGSNANACPTGTTLPITTEAACRAAAAAAGKPYGGMGSGTVTYPTFPKALLQLQRRPFRLCLAFCGAALHRDYSPTDDCGLYLRPDECAVMHGGLSR
jgi:hypothetical protein